MRTTTRDDISNFDDLIDVRDVIARVEELREEVANIDDMPEGDQLKKTAESAAIRDELKTLEALLEECRGNGGDEEWDGSWFPVTLIRESYFKTYAQELAEDIGAVNADAQWPNSCIDWDQAARELEMDYTAVDFGGTTYLTR